MTPCTNCGEPAAVSMCLPVDADGSYVPDRSPEEKGIDPACGVCANLHLAAGKNKDRMQRILELHRLGIEAVRDRLAQAGAPG